MGTIQLFSNFLSFVAAVLVAIYGYEYWADQRYVKSFYIKLDITGCMNLLATINLLMLWGLNLSGRHHTLLDFTYNSQVSCDKLELAADIKRKILIERVSNEL